jgi:hypothetical protein
MDLRKGTALMRLFVLAILLFNFVVSNTGRSQFIEHSHSCPELTAHATVNNQLGTHDSCPLEADEDDVVFESYIEFREIISEVLVYGMYSPLNYFLSGFFRPPIVS